MSTWPTKQLRATSSILEKIQNQHTILCKSKLMQQENICHSTLKNINDLCIGVVCVFVFEEIIV